MKPWFSGCKVWTSLRCSILRSMFYLWVAEMSSAPMISQGFPNDETEGFLMKKILSWHHTKDIHFLLIGEVSSARFLMAIIAFMASIGWVQNFDCQPFSNNDIWLQMDVGCLCSFIWVIVVSHQTFWNPSYNSIARILWPPSSFMISCRNDSNSPVGQRISCLSQNYAGSLMWSLQKYLGSKSGRAEDVGIPSWQWP